MSRPRLAAIGSCNAAGLQIAADRLSDARLRRSIFRILKENVLCSIAAVTAGNRAHINTAYFGGALHYVRVGLLRDLRHCSTRVVINRPGGQMNVAQAASFASANCSFTQGPPGAVTI